MHKDIKRASPALIAGSALIGSLVFAGAAFAAAPTAKRGFGHGLRPMVVGTVASTPDARGTFTVTAKDWKRGGTPSSATTATTYTVDTTSSTTVTKAGAASSVSAIAVGDTVMVRGALSGSTVAATAVRDGRAGFKGMPGQRPATTTPAITGNGEPVIGGSVSAISGSSITITNQGSTAYTIDASSAKITKHGVTDATLSNVVVGDRVVAQGTVNGTSMTASSVVDQGTAPTSSASGTGSAPAGHTGGFLGAIGGFFSRLFGFF